MECEMQTKKKKKKKPAASLTGAGSVRALMNGGAELMRRREQETQA
jgi:hypothetical protein